MENKDFPKKKINEETFPRIKKIIDSGAFSSKEVMKMFDICSATHYLIKSSDTYEDYRNRIAEASERAKASKRAKNAQAKATAAVAQPIVPNFYEAQLEIIIEQLKAINDKLSKMPVMKELYEEEDEPEVKRSFFGIKKPF